MTDTTTEGRSGPAPSTPRDGTAGDRWIGQAGLILFGIHLGARRLPGLLALWLVARGRRVSQQVAGHHV